MKCVLILLALALGACGADASVRVPLAVRPGNNMHLVTGSLDGVTCRLLVDTGATHTTFDLGFVTNRFPQAELMEVEVRGTTNVRTSPRYFSYGALKLGDFAFASKGAMALPLDGLSAAIGEPVDGILGMSEFKSVDFILSDDALVFVPEAKEREGFGPVVSAGVDPYRPYVVGEYARRKIPFLIDSGSSYTFVKEGLWPASTNRISLAATEISGRSGIAPRIGEEGLLHLGIPLALTPMIAPREPNYLGADTLKRYDVLFLSEAGGVAFRPRKAACAR